MTEAEQIQLTERFERYVTGLMSEEEKTVFERECEEDIDLKTAYESFLLGKWAVFESGYQEEKAALRDHFIQVDPGAPPKSLFQFSGRMVAAIAGLLLLLAGLWWWNSKSSSVESAVLYAIYHEIPRIPETMGTDTDSLLRAAYLQFDQGKYEAATKSFDQLLADTALQNRSAIFLYQGLSWLQLQNTAASIEAFTQSEQHIEQRDWYIAMAYLQADQLPELKTQLQMIAGTPGHFYAAKAQSLLDKLE